MTAELTVAEIATIHNLLWAAFASDCCGFTEHDWEHAVGGVHFVLERDGAVVAHASVVDRLLNVGERPIRCGYVEAVATTPRY
jgi:aminoglycoside 2'-N-acetyltransferase I